MSSYLELELESRHPRGPCLARGRRLVHPLNYIWLRRTKLQREGNETKKPRGSRASSRAGPSRAGPSRAGPRTGQGGSWLGVIRSEPGANVLFGFAWPSLLLLHWGRGEGRRLVLVASLEPCKDERSFRLGLLNRWPCEGSGCLPNGPHHKRTVQVLRARGGGLTDGCATEEKLLMSHSHGLQTLPG